MVKRGVTIKTVFATMGVVALMITCIILGDKSNYMLNWLGIIVYLYAIFTWKWERKESFFSMYTIFFTFFLLFSYGQCVMWALGIGLDRGIGTGILYYGSSIIPNESQMITAKWYTCICMLLFHYGAILFAGKSSVKTKTIVSTEKAYKDRELLYKCGCIVTTIVAPIAIYQRVKELLIAQTFGYKALYYGDLATQSGYIQILLYLFFPALLCLLIGSNFKKTVTRTVIIIFLIYAALGAMSGDRGSWIYSLVILIWVFAQRKKIRLKDIVFWGILGVFGLYMLNVITDVRNTGLDLLSIETFINGLSVEESPIVDTFFEMGGSMGIITFFLIVGNGIYPYGNTYVTAILGAISSRFLSLLGIKQVLIGSWFSQEYLGISWGTGFSMIGEAFVNGGYYGGFIYVFIIGIIIGRILSKCRDRSDMEQNPIGAFVSIAVLNIVSGLPRSAVYLVIKEFVYGVLIILLMVWLLQQVRLVRSTSMTSIQNID
ncbi:O-antigen polysaccharide polymerase Wzy [Dehalobacterium formicoaceticum]|uniref:O-antigen polysaccharide polymerase Wzy n=1 Tax=Dehalobacterium formicoaceticum TaxID=51515 RepID=UPI0018DF49C3|nr:O-antigen polysaccharide polymerase Wzy [Dehalobacterium formicoaceticum]